jgi:cellulose binding protein with CBM3 domain
VTQGELAKICSAPGTICGDVSSPLGSAGSTPLGSAGTATNGGSGLGPSGGAPGVGTAGNTSNSAGGLGGSTSGSGGGAQNPGGPATPISPSGGCVEAPPTAVGGDCAAEADLSVVYTDRSDAATFNQVTLTLNVENTGADFPLTDLVLRYWFAAEQGQTEFVAEVDYAQVGKENVCVTFGNQLGQSFADIGFTSNAPVGAGAEDVQVRLHTPNYAQQDQSNDFSFIEGAQNAANENITIYRAGTRVAGCEP